MTGELFQHSTLGALMAGMFEGSLKVEELLTHGSAGIGTLHGLDGELVVADGKAYQVKADGTVYLLEGEERIPYAAVTDFEPENSFDIEKEWGSEAFQTELIHRFSSENTFQAVKVSGTFKNMHCRSVEKQEPPYPRLVEAARSQEEFTRDSVEGTLVGFYAPEIFGRIAVPGFHLHFLSDKKDFGGHVLSFSVQSGTAEWQTMETLTQHFPVNNDQFMNSTIDYDNLKEEIEEAE